MASRNLHRLQCAEGSDQEMRIGIILLGLAASFPAQQPLPTPPQENPFLEFTGKTILIISPHPDDDIIGCGGALAYLAGKHNHILVVYLTSGEVGTYDASMKKEQLKAIRMQEAAAAYRALDLPDAELIWLNYPDGQLDFSPLQKILGQLTGIIRSRRPDAVFALDPGLTYFRYHYHDHRTAALVSADAVNAAEFPLEYPELGPAYVVPRVYYYYSAEPNLGLDIKAVYEKKISALSQHRSQFPPARTQYRPEGPLPQRSILEKTIAALTGQTSIEQYRAVLRASPKPL
jgi:LmbE family N-acetylglucosaminyl deacetylase